MPDTELDLRLSKADIVFIYGHFQKQLASIDKIASSNDCLYDAETIENQKAPYLSAINKIRSQYPNLTTMDKYF
ncbi:MAG: hypothetical protein ACI4FZ_08915 [Lachnospiraceae bacterium]